MSESSPRWSRAVLLAAWAWTVAIFVFLWMPPPPPPEIVWWWWDKLVHFGLFAAFGGLWTWHGVRGVWLLPLGVLVGAVTEVGQGLMPWERHSSWDDFGFDVVGLVVGVVVGRVLRPRAVGPRPAWW
ncbi:MAG: hypothetical protein AAGF11_47655 [Myxococcota bacterium]